MFFVHKVIVGVLYPKVNTLVFYVQKIIDVLCPQLVLNVHKLIAGVGVICSQGNWCYMSTRCLLVLCVHKLIGVICS